MTMERFIRPPEEGQPEVPQALLDAANEPPKTAEESFELMTALADNLGWRTGRWACVLDSGMPTVHVRRSAVDRPAPDW